MNPDTTAIILIGHQNDYFASDGKLASALQDRPQIQEALQNTVRLLEKLADSATTLIATPIIFTADYAEISDPVGILKTIKELEAFKTGTTGVELIPEIAGFGDRIEVVPGKRGLNAFAETDLHDRLVEGNIKDVVFAGVVTSLCIDSTARSAQEQGYRVTILENATSGRTAFEQEYHIQNIFPLYAHVRTVEEILKELLPAA